MAKDLTYNNISTSASLGSSDLLVPSIKAVKSYIDTTVSTLKSYTDTSVSAKEATLTKGGIIGAANQITVSLSTKSVIGANVTISLVSTPIVDNITVNSVLRVAAATTVSASTQSGTTGTLAWDNENIYICIGTDSWRKAATTDSW